MLSTTHHGRRRASAPPQPKKNQPKKNHSRTRWNIQLGFIAAAGLLTLTALPGANAGFHEHSGPTTAGAAELSSLDTTAVTADKDAPITFAQPSLASKAKPTPAAAPAAVPLGALDSPVPVPQSSAALQSPLETLTMTSPFGYRINPLTGAADELHRGTDFGASCGTAVFSAGAGTVTEAGWHPYGGGNRVVIDHGGGIKSTYNHLSSIGVSVGVPMGAGTPVGEVGTTGNSTGCHLHFEVMLNDEVVDAAGYL